MYDDTPFVQVAVASRVEHGFELHSSARSTTSQTVPDQPVAQPHVCPLALLASSEQAPPFWQLDAVQVVVGAVSGGGAGASPVSDPVAPVVSIGAAAPDVSPVASAGQAVLSGQPLQESTARPVGLITWTIYSPDAQGVQADPVADTEPVGHGVHESPSAAGSEFGWHCRMQD